MASHFATLRPNARALLLCVLALSLWVAGTLGLVHRALHLPHGSGPAQWSAAAGAAHATHPHGLAALFGDHSDADCRLYDQLSHGPAALGVPMLVLPVFLPAATFAWLEGEALARWTALFDARGPPPSC